MSRRAIALIGVFLGALVIANIIVVAIWLPNRKTGAAKREASNSTSVTSPATSASSPPNNTSPAATVGPTSGNAAQPAVGFALERQLTSPSGHIRIKYFRDPKTKMRRIALEDVRRSGTDAVLCESKHTLWALVSPDDQWIAVNERNAADGGGIRLYHRESDSSLRYLPAEGSGPQGHTLQDTVWLSYIRATHADPNTPRRGVTVDATGWEGDSRKLNLSVAYLPAPDNPDVPEPWSCSYDLASKQVEPTPDQPVAASAMANGPTGDQDDSQLGATQEQGPEQQSAAADSSAINEQDANMDTAAEAELPGEKFAATRLDELTVPDVNESSLSEITYAINEMYARHGADFKDKKVAEQFSEFSWYKRRPGVTSADVEAEFTDLEKQNLKVLQRCRDAKVAAARRKSRPVHGEKAEEETTGQKILRGFRAWQDAGAPMPPHP
jgi:YARHG domain